MRFHLSPTSLHNALSLCVRVCVLLCRNVLKYVFILSERRARARQRAWLAILRTCSNLDYVDDIDVGGGGGHGGHGDGDDISDGSSNNNKQRQNTNVIKMNRYRCIGAEANLMGKCEKGVLWRWPKNEPQNEMKAQANGAKISIFARLAIAIIEMRLIVHVRSSHSRGQRAATRCQLPVTSYPHIFFFLLRFREWVCNVLAPFLYLFSLWYEWPIRIRIMACRCSTTQGPIRCYSVFAWDAQILAHAFSWMWPTPQSANDADDATQYSLLSDTICEQLN